MDIHSKFFPIWNLRGGSTRQKISSSSIITSSVLTKEEKIDILSGRTTSIAPPPKLGKKRVKKPTAPPPIPPIARACIPSAIWSTLSTRDFQNPSIIEALSQTGIQLCNIDSSSSSSEEEIEWKPDSKTESILKQHATEDDLHHALLKSLPPNTILIWTTKFSNPDCYGANLPLIKSRGIVHGMSPRDIASLLMDSSRVKTYNKISLGRDDVTVFQDGIDTTKGKFGDGETKIVRNLTKPPLVRSLMEFRTLMHSRKLREEECEDGGYLVVSRAVGKDEDIETKEDQEEEGKVLTSEIMIGANLLRGVKGRKDATDFTSVTHVNSPFVHPMVAGRVGMKGAVDFLNDIRALGR